MKSILFLAKKTLTPINVSIRLPIAKEASPFWRQFQFRTFSDDPLRSKPPIRRDPNSFDYKIKKHNKKVKKEREEKSEGKEKNEEEDDEPLSPFDHLKPPPIESKDKVNMDSVDFLSPDSIFYRRMEHDPTVKRDYNLNTVKGLLVFWFVLAVVAFKDEWYEDIETRSEYSGNTDEMLLRNWEVSLLKKLPWKLLSRVWGFVTEQEVPESWRKSIYGIYATMFQCDLKEMKDPLESYRTFGEFFARRLKDGVRPISTGFVSPVDGTVLHYGEITENMMEQVKGISYSLKAFIGEQAPITEFNESKHVGKKLYHCIIYLAPGDYHGFHSPVDWTVNQTTHFPGTLFPVKPSWATLVKGLFSVNERVAITGNWEHGFFSFTPVGALNVGSIVLSFDKELKTNGWVKPKSEMLQKHYINDKMINFKKGDEIGFFHMGSTVVMIFESPEFMFRIAKGQHVKLGETIGHIIPEQWRLKHTRPKQPLVIQSSEPLHQIPQIPVQPVEVHSQASSENTQEEVAVKK